MALVACPECKKEISSKAASCPNCGHPMQRSSEPVPMKAVATETPETPKPKKKTNGCLMVFLGGFAIVSCLAVVANLGDKSSEGGSNSASTASPAPSPGFDVQIPIEQLKLARVVDSTRIQYKLADNELNKSLWRTARGENIREGLKSSRRAQNWVGRVKSMQTNGEGKAILEIELLNSKIVVKTWNNALSDISDGTLIDQNTDLYGKIAELSKKEIVYFSGKFLRSDEKDFLKEGSMTEEGSMVEPEFIFAFSDVRPVAKQ